MLGKKPIVFEKKSSKIATYLIYLTRETAITFVMISIASCNWELLSMNVYASAIFSLISLS